MASQGRRSVELAKRLIVRACPLIADVLHLYNLEFIVAHNMAAISIVADFFSVQASAVKTTLAYKTEDKKELYYPDLDLGVTSDDHNDTVKVLCSFFFREGYMNTPNNAFTRYNSRYFHYSHPFSRSKYYGRLTQSTRSVLLRPHQRAPAEPQPGKHFASHIVPLVPDFGVQHLRDSP